MFYGSNLGFTGQTENTIVCSHALQREWGGHRNQLGLGNPSSTGKRREFIRPGRDVTPIGALALAAGSADSATVVARPPGHLCGPGVRRKREHRGGFGRNLRDQPVNRLNPFIGPTKSRADPSLRLKAIADAQNGLKDFRPLRVFLQFPAQPIHINSQVVISLLGIRAPNVAQDLPVGEHFATV